MSQGIRWSTYVPASTAGGLRVAAPDEDPFTLVATALELGISASAPSRPLARIDLVGDCPPVADWGLAALLGTPLEITRHPAGPAAFHSALETLGKGLPPGRSGAVVAAEIPERSAEGAPNRGGAPGAAAVAAWVDGADGGRGFSFEEFEGTGGVVEAAFSRWRTRAPGSSEVWLGEWGAEPSAGRSVDLERVLAAAQPSLSAVSEGAYVSRSRYLENLPSRWRFVAEECDACGARTFPARGVCRRCGNGERLRATSLPTEGATVVAATWIGPGGQPTEFDAQVAAMGGYGVVLADLAPGARVTLQVTDADPGEVVIGSRVGTRLRRLYPMEGEWRYGRKAVPRPRPPPSG